MALNISKFLKQFYMEAREKLTAIQARMVDLENNPQDKEAIHAIQRDMHTIKGSSRMVGLKEISAIAHLLEEAFLQLHSERIRISAPGMTVLYHGVDVVATLLSQSESGQPFSDGEEILRDIQSVIDGVLPEPKAMVSGETGESGGKKKFKLDFRSLKQKLSKSSAAEPENVAASFTETSEAPELEPPEDEPRIVAPEMKDAPSIRPPLMAGVPSPVRPLHAAKEKSYLKIPGEQVDTIINQVTDLLSRRYFFNNVLQSNRELAALTRGLREEWQRFKSSESGMMQLEAINNIDNMMDMFTKKIQDFGRWYQVNLTNFEGALRDVYDNLLDVKLTPLSSIFNIYPRFVRDYAYRSGKKIQLFIRGGDTQLDKTVIEKINEPLIHLLRNACDHGIESPEEREKAGKSPTGVIIIEANKKSNHVEISIIDDGQGLDIKKIVSKAVELGIVTEEAARTLKEEEIQDLIFHTGFSTVSCVSDTSGRGIGMDIVKRVTQQFGGSVHIVSKARRGATFRMEFPISVSTYQVTFIREEGKVYALPSNLIRKIVKLNPGEIKEKIDYSVVIHNDEIYTVAKLNQVLSGETLGVGRQPVFMILPKVTERKIGIIVDCILHESEVIVKDLGSFIGKNRFVLGMVIGERGELQTVLDIHDVAASDEFSRKIKILTPYLGRVSETPTILVVDDSLLVREMERNLLENAGYRVVVGINGLDGYNKALGQRFDLVLADIEMPEMDGFEMVENIKKIVEYADVPTIVLSTVEKEEDKIRGLNLGVNAWLQKQDFDEKEFLKVVKRLIG